MLTKRLEKRLAYLNEDLDRLNEKAEWSDSITLIDDIREMVCMIDELEMKLMEVAK